MQNATQMGMMNGPGNFDQQPCRAPEPFGIPRRCCGIEFTQMAALNQRHGEVMLAIVLTGFIKGNNVGMIQLGDGLDLDLEAEQCFRRGEQAGLNQLQRQSSLQAKLARAVDHSHSATSDFSENLVIAEEAGLKSDVS